MATRKAKDRERTLVWGDGYVETRTNRDGSIRHQARWPELNARGKRVLRAKSFPTAEAAGDYLRSMGRDKRAGRYVAETQLTVAEMIAEYMARSAGRWKPNTYETYRIYRDRLIIPEFGARKIVDLTPHQIQLWVDRLAARKLSPSAIANAFTLLSASLKEATNLGLLDRNPATGVRLPSRSRVARPTWTIQDARRVLDALADDPLLHALYAVAIMTGMRPGELRALRWSDVNLTRSLIVCSRTITRDQEMQPVMGTSTKTARSRVIAIPAFVVVALERWRKVQLERRLAHPAWIDDGIVFDRGDGQFLPQESLQVHHRRVLELAGVPRIRLHDIRHTYATIELEGGTNPKIVQERMGHRSIATTLDLYTHVSVDLQQAAADHLAQRLLTAVDDTTTSEGESGESDEMHA